jgi:hypothetical protein
MRLHKRAVFTFSSRRSPHLHLNPPCNKLSCHLAHVEGHPKLPKVLQAIENLFFETWEFVDVGFFQAECGEGGVLAMVPCMPTSSPHCPAGLS